MLGRGVVDWLSCVEAGRGKSSTGCRGGDRAPVRFGRGSLNGIK